MDRSKNLASFMNGNDPEVPHVAYHGSDRDVKEFNTALGAWFTDKPALANEYASKDSGNVYPVHLAIKNPIKFVHAEQRKKIGEVISHALNGMGDLAPEQINKAQFLVDKLRQTHGNEPKALFEFWRNDPNIAEFFRTLGYDGISAFEKADRKTKTWAVLHPEQVKSAIGNEGAFDPSNPDITKAEGGEVDEPGITAYHGSPHDFERFDMSKIGTGEGAQAYGHGLYFAENPAVAKSYRPIASENKPVPIIVDGKKFENPTAMQKLVAQHQGNVDAVHKAMSPHWERAALAFQSAPQDPDDLGYMLAEDDHRQALAQKAELDALRGKKVEHDYSGHHQGHALAGHSYEVRINAHPDHFLDWDKPLKDQHEHVQKAIHSLPYGRETWLADTPNLYAALEDARSSWMQQHGQDTRGYQKHKVSVSNDLRQAGLPGIKYLDQGSVNAMHKGTRNYVVFDDKLVNVKRKYAKGGIVQGGAPIHALHLTSKFGNSLPSAVNQAKAATRRRP